MVMLVYSRAAQGICENPSCATPSCEKLWGEILEMSSSNPSPELSSCKLSSCNFSGAEPPVFKLAEEARDGEARACSYFSAHGVIETPCFMPVGTQASLKGVEPSVTARSGARVILANSYHLLLRPGLEVLRNYAGVRSFMRWDGALLTDSGGFQAMSLGELVKVEDGGIKFRSHIDGSALHLTPELAMEAQIVFDSTIAMMLDECVPSSSSHARCRVAVERSLLWGSRCSAFWREKRASSGTSSGVGGAGDGAGAGTGGAGAGMESGTGTGTGFGRALFGILQGGLDLDLRREALERTLAIGFDGYAFGGLALGEEQSLRSELLAALAPLLPRDRPRYLMGVGKPRDIAEAIACGIDLFDCVLPTRSGRTGQAFCFADGYGYGAYGYASSANKNATRTRNIRNARYKFDKQPLEEDCACPSCAGGFSRAYLHHLFRSGEMLGAMLLSAHNIFFYQRFMRSARAAIMAGTYSEFLKAVRAHDDDRQSG